MSGKRGRRVITPGDGRDLIVLAGLPLNQFRFVRDQLDGDACKGAIRVVGAPAPGNDWGGLYKPEAIKLLVAQIGDSLKDSARLPTPRRIIVAYVPGVDTEALLERLDFFAFSTRLEPDASLWFPAPSESSIAWRRQNRIAKQVVIEAIDRAVAATHVLKAEVTDNSRSNLILPPRNFRFPHNDSEIAEMYRELRHRQFDLAVMERGPKPQRWTREQVDGRAFKGSQGTGAFFTDAKGRIYPPDPYHGRTRVAEQAADRAAILALRQRYRFGLLARNGELHYDVQYPLPRRLQDEAMTCGHAGEVLVTGSHANTGLNDVIWAPDGTIKPVPEKNNGAITIAPRKQ